MHKCRFGGCRTHCQGANNHTRRKITHWYIYCSECTGTTLGPLSGLYSWPLLIQPTITRNQKKKKHWAKTVGGGERKTTHVVNEESHIAEEGVLLNPAAFDISLWSLEMNKIIDQRDNVSFWNKWGDWRWRPVVNLFSGTKLLWLQTTRLQMKFDKFSTR